MEKWSHDIETKWHPPEGFFEQSAEKIAHGLKAVSDSLAQAMDRLNFYINRAGEKLDPKRKEILAKAKEILHNLYK